MNLFIHSERKKYSYSDQHRPKLCIIALVYKFSTNGQFIRILRSL
jgi:hypothetical protein